MSSLSCLLRRFSCFDFSYSIFTRFQMSRALFRDLRWLSWEGNWKGETSKGMQGSRAAVSWLKSWRLGGDGWSVPERSRKASFPSFSSSGQRVWRNQMHRLAGPEIWKQERMGWGHLEHLIFSHKWLISCGRTPWREGSAPSCLVFQAPWDPHWEVLEERRSRLADVRGIKEDEMSPTHTVVSASDWLWVWKCQNWALPGAAEVSC